MRRPRGPGGRFLTAEEIAAQQKAAAENADTSNFQNPNPSAEERKALKASESAAAAAVASSTSNVESSQTNFAPIDEVLVSSNGNDIISSAEYDEQNNTASTTTPTQETFPAQSQATNVQYMDMSAGPGAAGNALQ